MHDIATDLAQMKLRNKSIREAEIELKKTEVSYYPDKLQIEHSTLCNARCIMCSHSFTDNARRGFIDEEVVEKLQPVLPYVQKILLHGMGEALLHPDIEKYLALYGRYEIEVSCITNMSVMNASLAELLGRACRTITISCDGATKETFEGIRQGISFEQFCKNIKLLHMLQPQLELRFNVVCMRQNIAEMPGIIQLAASLGVGSVGISDMVSQKALNNLHDEIRLYPGVSAYYLRKAREEAQRLGVRLLQFPEYIMRQVPEKSFAEEVRTMRQLPFCQSKKLQENLKKRYRQLNAEKPTRKADLVEYAQPSRYTCEGICDYLVERPFICANGDVTTCCIDGIHVMGNLKVSGFMEIWNAEVYQKMRALFFSGCIPKYCVGCMLIKNNTNIRRLKLTNYDEQFLDNPYAQLLDK